MVVLILTMMLGFLAVIRTNCEAIETGRIDEENLHEGLCTSLDRWLSPSIRPELGKQGEGWGIYAQAEIPADEVVMRIPLNETIAKQTFVCSKNGQSRCEVVGKVYEHLNRISNDAEEIALATYLLLDDAHPYALKVVEAAGKSYSPIPTEVINKILKPVLPELAERYETIFYLVNEALRILHGSSSFASFNEQDLQRALFAVTSRSFFLPIGTDGKRTVVMVPCGDLFNHEEHPKAVRFIVEENKTLVFRTRRPYARGEELRIDYGDKSSEDLLFQYGFFMKNSKRSVVRISLADVTKWPHGYHPVKQATLDGLTVGSRKVKLSTNGLLGHGLGLIRTLSLSNDELSAYVLANVLGLGADAPSPETETNAALLLEAIVYDELLKYKKVFDENEVMFNASIVPEVVNDLLVANIRVLAAAWRRTNSAMDV